MNRDSRSAFRSRVKATEASVDAAVAATRAELDAKFLAAREAARAREVDRHRFTREELIGATHVRDRYDAVREVVRVNQKTVTVSTPWSWTETIPFEQVRTVWRVAS